MSRAGGSRHDRTPDSVLPESRLVNEEAADRVWKLMVPEGQRGASVVTSASFPPATDRPGCIVLFTSFVVAGLVPPFSTFFLQILETFGLQLVHLSPNSVVILAVFAHLCEIFVGVPPSVTLFWHFFVLRSARKKRGLLGLATGWVRAGCNQNAPDPKPE